MEAGRDGNGNVPKSKDLLYNIGPLQLKKRPIIFSRIIFAQKEILTSCRSFSKESKIIKNNKGCFNDLY